MNTITITRKEAVEKIEKSRGKIFAVVFVKRTSGEIRHMTARLGVKKGVNGKGRNFDPKSKGLISAFDLNIAKRAKINAEATGVEQTDIGHRLISIEGIKSLSIEGNKYEVV